MSPSDAKILRDEAEAAVKEEGWTKEALAKMVKMDSYIRESSRVHPMSLSESLKIPGLLRTELTA